MLNFEEKTAAETHKKLYFAKLFINNYHIIFAVISF